MSSAIVQDPGAELRAKLGTSRVLTAPDEVLPFTLDWTRRYGVSPAAVVLPRSAEEAAAAVAWCHGCGMAVVPQGGLTGLCGGAVAQGDRPSVVISLKRMNAIRRVDLLNDAITVEAGCVLADVQQAAEESGRRFPLQISSLGSCQVGGLVSTNAGGIGVLRYGMMRDFVLGLEVVLPDGRIWNGLRALRKDNTGYDLKQMFIGAEGTLGLVTAATLKLHPRLAWSKTFMVSLDAVEAALDLLLHMRERLGGVIEAFELMSASQLSLVVDTHPDLQSPVAGKAPWYVIGEAADGGEERGEAVLAALEAALEAGIISDAVLAASDTQAEAIWRLRHSVGEGARRTGLFISTDPSVPVSAIPAFVAAATRRLTDGIPGAIVAHVGHVADGNIHVIVVIPGLANDSAERPRLVADTVAIVQEEALAHDGSFAAEHGVGQVHVGRLCTSKSPVELDLMHAVKAALDPGGIMNPGKLLAAR